MESEEYDFRGTIMKYLMAIAFLALMVPAVKVSLVNPSLQHIGIHLPLCLKGAHILLVYSPQFA